MSSIGFPTFAQISALVEQKEELDDELESAQAALKRKDIEIQQLRAQNEAMRSELQGEVRMRIRSTPPPAFCMPYLRFVSSWLINRLSWLFGPASNTLTMITSPCLMSSCS